jgi:maleate cis-trans isomerase
MYGWRGRIGLLVPSINTVMETEFWRIAPEGVAISTARIAGGRHGTPDELRNMEKEAIAAASRVANTEPGVIVYGCTSGSFFEGPEWSKRICQQITDVAKAPAITTAAAMAEALTRTGRRKVAVVTPYVEVTNERLKHFLRAFNIETTKLGTFDMLDMFDHAKIQPSEIYAKAKEVALASDCDAVFVACTQLRALEVLDALERDLGKPVYSAVQVSAWMAYQLLGVDPQIKNCGSLLASLSEDRQTSASPRPHLKTA